MSSAATPLQDIDRVVRALDAEFIRHANAKDAGAIAESFYAAVPPWAPRSLQGGPPTPLRRVKGRLSQQP